MKLLAIVDVQHQQLSFGHCWFSISTISFILLSCPKMGLHKYVNMEEQYHLIQIQNYCWC